MRALVLASFVALVATSSMAHGGGESFKVIVNPANPVGEVERAFLRSAYLKKATDWNGETIRPVDLPRKDAVRDRFTTSVIGKTPAQLRSYWNQQIFSGKGVPPPEADGPEAVVAYVLAHKGAVGYVPASFDAGRARVVPVR